MLATLKLTIARTAKGNGRGADGEETECTEDRFFLDPTIAEEGGQASLGCSDDQTHSHDAANSRQDPLHRGSSMRQIGSGSCRSDADPNQSYEEGDRLQTAV